MKLFLRKHLTVVGLVCLCAAGITFAGISGVQAEMPAFDFSKMSDMSGYDPSTFENPTGDVIKIGVVEAFSGPGAFNGQIYWMADVLERAGSTDPEQIIKTWEGDTYKAINGVVHMRACDHQMVRDLVVAEYEFPNKYYDTAAAPGKTFVVPAEYAFPAPPADLERCKK